MALLSSREAVIHFKTLTRRTSTATRLSTAALRSWTKRKSYAQMY